VYFFHQIKEVLSIITFSSVFLAVHTAYGISQARGQIQAAAATYTTAIATPAL